MRKTISLLLAVCALCTACSTVRRVSTDPAQPWVGYTTMDIIYAMGDPVRIDTDGKGGSILVYESTPDYSSPDYDLLDPNPSVRTRKYAYFYLDDRGDCYRVDTNRDLPSPPRSILLESATNFWVDILFVAPFLVMGLLL